MLTYPWRLIYYAPMDKAITVSKTYRVTMTADAHKAFKVWCAVNDTPASLFIARHIHKAIKTIPKGVQPDLDRAAADIPQQTPDPSVD
jgi:hypothetical protein